MVGQFLMSFIRHADCVKIANFSQLVNVIAPLLTRGDELLKQSIYYAFRLFSSRQGGVSLRCPVDGPSYASERHGEVPYLDCAAVMDGTKLHVFAVNRHLDGPLELAVEFGGSDIARVVDAEILCADLKAENSFEAPDAVRSETFEDWTVSGSTGNAAAMLPAHSLVAATFELAR